MLKGIAASDGVAVAPRAAVAATGLAAMQKSGFIGGNKNNKVFVFNKHVNNLLHYLLDQNSFKPINIF